jgi:fructose-1,6-bisphosphatase III
MAISFDPAELTLLRSLAAQYPTTDAAVAEIAAAKAGLGLSKGVIQVVSDVHGEYRKLRHVINNASGNLRPMIDSLFASRLDDAQRRELLIVLYYPRETMEFLKAKLADRTFRRQWVRRTLRLQFELVRALARGYRRSWTTSFFPPERRELFEELFDEPTVRPDTTYVDAILDSLNEHDADLAMVRLASRLVRNLTAAEIIVAGDLGDRGPRIDRVIEFLIQQPNCSVLWGNHDAEWMGACLGSEACIATVLRFSARYRRFSQLEEGYGVLLEPLEQLARQDYGDDPCTQFKLVGTGLRDDLLMARMQKAAAIMQLKAEAHAIRRHPEWNLEHRNLLHRINWDAGTVEIDGKTYPLLDRNFPTVDRNDSYAFSPRERACMDRLRQSFIGSQRLWEHMKWVVRRGGMWCRRDSVLIFHACLAVDAKGEPLPLVVDGQPLTGRAQMDALDSLIRRAYRKGAEAVGPDADWFWYLWAGPRSPLFGKDKIATFEGYFVADKTAREEHKNAYFELIHDAEFVKKIGRDFGMGDDVLIVNGHVPVKIEKGENPVKRGGNAVTIDGAFSEAYGDHGYTLILDPDRIALAEHAHFDSVSDVIQSGKDMVPKVCTIRALDRPRLAAETEAGDALRQRITALEKLIRAYEEGVLAEK